MDATNIIDWGIMVCGAMVICCAILIPLSKLADWLQGKLDEWNEYNDKQQLNNAEQ
jgi:hypothetical protein